MRHFIILVFVLFLLSISVSVSSALNINHDNYNAPIFSLKDSSGKVFNLGDYVGPDKKEPAKGIIINFFASYCMPCRYDLPVLNSLVDEFNTKGIKVVIIGFEEDFDRIKKQLAAIKVDKPIVLSDRDGRVGERYRVIGLPMTFFIDSDGKIRDFILGELPNIEKVFRDKAGMLSK